MKKRFFLPAVLITLSLAVLMVFVFRTRQPANAPASAATQPQTAEKPVSAGAVSNPGPGATSGAVASAARRLAPAAAKDGHVMSNPEETLLAGAVTLISRETPPDAQGLITRTRLVRADFKYPLLRVEEKLDAKGSVISRWESVGDHVLVKVRAGAEAEFADAVTAAGGQLRKKMYAPQMYLVSFAPADLDTVPNAVAALGKAGQVIEYAEPDHLMFALDTTPNDTDFNLLWGMKNTGQVINSQTGTAGSDIDAVKAWDLTTGSTNIVVGIIDTGIDYTHSDLAGNIWHNPGEISGNSIDDDSNGFTDDVYGWDFCNDDNNPMDDHYHGTHCAGTIGGVGNNSLGVAGVNWTVKMMALKFLSSSGSGASSDAVDSIYYATRMRAKLTSNSWGSSPGSPFEQTLYNAIENANQSNVLFVAAAGNASNDNDVRVTYPGSYTNANVIAVAATDNQDRLASFSCYGLTSVDIGAPGVAIWSCETGDQYQFLNGTSMATPHVAGACALVWALNPDTPSAQIKKYILDGAEPISALSNKCVTGGRLNVYNSCQKTDWGIKILPYGDAIFSGAEGGPFSPVLFTYTISNEGTNSISWKALKAASWLSLSPTNGTLAVGQSTNVQVSITSAANSLAVSNYTDLITFTNLTSGGVAKRTAILQVLDALFITPASGTGITGPVGGPFTPGSATYMLSNLAATARGWTVTKNVAWLDLSATSGNLAAGATSSVLVSVNANANSLALGSYSGAVTFSNTTSHLNQTRPFSLQVYEALVVSPTNDRIMNGPVGGPFSPGSYVVSISNRSPGSTSWSVTPDVNWLDFSATSGTLAGGAASNITVTINTNANNLSLDTYTGSLSFSNHTSHTAARQVRIILRAGIDDFSERFEPNTFDIQYRSFMFTPDGTTNYYSVYAAPVSTYPVDPTGGNTILTNVNDGQYVVSLTGNKKVKFFGNDYGTVYINDNGFVTFQSNSLDNYPTWNNHFKIPKVSLFFCNLMTYGTIVSNGTFHDGYIGGTISYKQLSDRFVVTYDKVPVWNGSGVYASSNSCQLEMFFDGKIRMTYLHMEDKQQYGSVVGLSRGYAAQGLLAPVGFTPSDFSSYAYGPGFYALITNLTEGTYFVSSAGIPIAAQVITNTAPATQVDFYHGSTFIASDTTAPYSIIWSNAANGSYVLSAVAYDSSGTVATSPPVSVVVASTSPQVTWDGWASMNGAYTWNYKDNNWNANGSTFYYRDGTAVKFSSYDPNLIYIPSYINIDPAVVTPASVTITNAGGAAKTFCFTGGIIGGNGPLLKAGPGTAIFSNYTADLTFSGGTTINGGLLAFLATTNGISSGTRTQWFGTGGITLNGGKFKLGAAVLADGTTNIFANNFTVGANGGTINFTRAQTGFPSPKIVFAGNFNFAGNAALNLDASGGGSALSGVDVYGHEIAGSITLNGTGTINRISTAAGVAFTLSGNIVDGTGPGTLVISNAATDAGANRHMKLRGANNTYSGGTIIGNDGTVNNFSTFFGSVEAGTNVTLGTGNVTVNGGGCLRLLWSNNIANTAALEIQVNPGLASGQQTGVVWVAAGVTQTVNSLTLGSLELPPGIYGANNYPGFLPGPGFIQSVSGGASNYLLTVQANNPAWGSVSPTGGVYDAGASVQITATASNHYHFVSWIGGITSVANPANVSIDAEKTVTAVFAGDPLTLSVSSAYGTPAPNGTVTNGYGSTLTVSVDSPVINGITQFVCTGWTMTGNEPQTGTGSSFSMTPTNNAVLTWLWTTNIVLPPPLPFSETFETSPTNMAGVLGAVNGQHGWISDATNNVVTTAQANGGSQSLSIGTGTVSHAFNNSSGTVHISYWALPVTGTTNPTVPANASAVFWVNSGKQIVAYSNNQPVVAGGTVNTGVWNRFDITCDYTSHVWSLSVNGTNVLQNFEFYSSQSSFSGVQFITPGQMYLDDVNISNTVAEIPPVYFTLTVNGMTGGSVNPTGGVYLAGSNVQISANASNYYHFAQWSGDLSDMSNPANVTMNTDKVVNAVFTANLVTNNVPAWWLAQYNLATNDAGALSDSDLDGLAAWQEYIAGTIPTNAVSVFQITELSIPGATIVRWSAVSGRVYTVYWTSNLLNGFQQILGTNVPWTGNVFTDSTHNAEQQGFYQIKVRLAP